MTIYYTIYKSTNLINGMIYVGQHETYDLNDSYLGSGAYFNNALNSYGKETFKKEILFIFDNFTEMNDTEIEIVNEEFIRRNDTYNLILGGRDKGIKGYTHTAETKEKLSLINKGKTYSDETRRKMSVANIGKTYSDETRQRMSNSAKGRVHSEETIRKRVETRLRNNKIRLHNSSTNGN